MFIRSITFISLSLITIGLSGCFSSNPESIKAFMMPDEADTTAENYILQPPDVIQVYCTKLADTSVAGIHGVRQTIRPDGKISFEDLGEIEAAGKTPKQLAEILKSKAMEFYELTGDHPIDVQIVVNNSKTYYVLGQVLVPGPKVYTGRDTFLSAISSARPNPMAWIERIQVIRPSQDENVKPDIFEVNFDRMMAHGDTMKNVMLQEGDIIYVPPTVLGWMALKVEEFIRPIARAFSGVYIMRRGTDSDRYY